MGFVFLLPTLAVLPSKARLSTNWWLMNPAKDDPFCLQTQADSGWQGEAVNPGCETQAGESLSLFGHRRTVLLARMKACHHTGNTRNNG